MIKDDELLTKRYFKHDRKGDTYYVTGLPLMKVGEIAPGLGWVQGVAYTKVATGETFVRDRVHFCEHFSPDENLGGARRAT